MRRFSLLVLLLLQACGPAPSAAPPVARPAASPSSSTPPLVLPGASPSPLLTQPSAAPSQTGNQLSVDKTSYAAGETITVRFAIRSEDKKDATAWVGLLSADVPHGSETENDKFDLSFQYLEERLTGEMRFQAPITGGAYELRLHDTDENGRELAAVAFEVRSPVIPVTGNQLVLNKQRYAPGEAIEVTVSIKAEDKADETAWVGLIPAAVEHGDEAVNDRYALDYRLMGAYLSGKMRFVAPRAPGLYDLRLHSSDTAGRELAFVSFLVE